MQTAQPWLHQDSITTCMSNSFAKMVSVEPRNMQRNAITTVVLQV